MGRERRFLAERDETAGILKQLKGVTSADLFALEKKGLDRETKHQRLMKAETKEVSVLSKAIQEKETVDLKLEQSANEVAKSVEAQERSRSAAKAGEATNLERQAAKYRHAWAA